MLVISGRAFFTHPGGVKENQNKEFLTKVKKLMLCTDRDVPGKMVTIVEFESWDTATDNNELDATQEGAAEAQATTDITYQNLDVHHEWVR